MVAASRGNRSVGYLMELALYPLGLMIALRRFAHSASGLISQRIVYLLSIYMCVFDTNISAGTYLAFGLSLPT